MISQQAIDEYKTLYEEEYGIDLIEEEAIEKAKLLLSLFKVTYKPIVK